MKIKLAFLSIILFTVFNSNAQHDLQNYKYVIVPNKFDFQKKENSYRINELTQFLFNKNGFMALMEGEGYPEDLSSNGCLALRSNVFSEPGMFTTKLKVVLKDCNDKVVYTSKVGESREKEYKVAYHKALRDAFTSFKTLNYSYKPSEKNNVTFQNSKVSSSNQTTEEIEKLKKEIKALKHKKETKKTQLEKTSVQVEKPGIQDKEATTTSNKTSKTASSEIIDKNSKKLLYAQPNSNGFQVVDTTPKIVMVLIKTSLENVFVVKDKDAIVYKKEGVWLYSDSATATEQLNLKF